MSWSRDGSRLAIQLDRRDLNTEIYAIAPDGTDLTRLTRDLAADILPAYSPDGSRVAFARGSPVHQRPVSWSAATAPARPG